MSVINEVLEAVMDMIDGLNLFAKISRGALPAGAGLTCKIGPSTPSEVYLSKDAYIPLDVTLNGKHSNLKTLSEAMNTIHAALTRATSYPEDINGNWEIVDISTNTLPQEMGREENNDWLMASSLAVKFYWKGDSTDESSMGE